MIMENFSWRTRIATVGCLLLCIINHAVGSEFCYRDEEGCGPNSEHWDGVCHTGKHQSPIDLPLVPNYYGVAHLRLNAYKASSFRIQNSGHTVSVDFVGASSPANEPFFFPDAISVKNVLPINHQETRSYKFSSAHFHWGTTDNNGSEHCVMGRCSAMEMHLVHYLSNYSSQAEAASSGDPNALTVLGVRIDSSYVYWTNAFNEIFGGGKLSPLSPIVKHLGEVSPANTNSYDVVNEAIDLTPLLRPAVNTMVYSYKGSLTTPKCNEQVNWFVLKNEPKVPAGEIQKFRSLLKDGRGKTLDLNKRPIQPKNGREVVLSEVIPA